MKLSCIVPVLNEKEHISAFITSLSKQTYRPIELIFVDGGSEDGTFEYIKQVQASNTDPNLSIELYHESGINSPANAKNIGLDHVSGDLVLIIDSDSVFICDDTLSTAIYEMGSNSSILIRFCPVINTEVEAFVSSISDPGGAIIYNRMFIGNNRFTASLGFGEDREFVYSLFGNLDYLGLISSAKIGRHFPHTVKEYANQNEWYGNTIVKYMASAMKNNTSDVHALIIYIGYNIFVCICPVVCLVRVYKKRSNQCNHVLKYGVLSKIYYSYIASLFFVKGLSRYLFKSM
jgi:glycosyltransferase involved in cell wall biosynthesis